MDPVCGEAHWHALQAEGKLTPLWKAILHYLAKPDTLILSEGVESEFEPRGPGS